MEKEVLTRMLTEFTELNGRIEKLRAFILDKEKFDTVDAINKDLLIAQFKAMETYLSILSIRLGINAKPEDAEELQQANETTQEDEIEELVPEVVNE